MLVETPELSPRVAPTATTTSTVPEYRPGNHIVAERQMKQFPSSVAIATQKSGGLPIIMIGLRHSDWIRAHAET